MGLYQLLGLTPPQADEIEMQDLGLDAADRQAIDEVMRALQDASVRDPDAAIGLLFTAGQRLGQVRQQNHRDVVTARADLQELIDLQATTESKDLAEDARGWRKTWSELSSGAKGGIDPRRLDSIEAFGSQLETGIARHAETLRRLRTVLPDSALNGIESALATQRETLQQALAAADLLPCSLENAQALEEALTEALEACERDCNEALDNQLPAELETLRKHALAAIAELTQPGKRSPGQVRQAVAKLQKGFDALRLSVVRKHNAVLRAELEKELEAVLLRAREGGVELDRNAVQTVRDELVAFGNQDYLMPPVHPKRALHRLALTVYDGERAQATARDKLPIAKLARQQHASLGSELPLEALMARMVPASLKNLGPGPLGVASPGYAGSSYPDVACTPHDGQWTIQPTQAREAIGHSCHIMPIGEFELGEILGVNGDSVTVSAGDDLNTYRGLAGASKGWVGCMLKRGISKETYQAVELRELEHLVDFSHAFRISCGRLAQAVNSVAGRPFKSADDALLALIKALDGDAKTLIPANPREPAQWQARAREVMLALSDLSMDRDRQGTHSPAGNLARKQGSDVIIEPVFKAVSLDTQAIIALQRVPVVFHGRDADQDKPQGATLELQSVHRLKKKYAPIMYKTLGGQDVMDDVVDKGRSVTIASAVDNKKVWVGIDAVHCPDLASFWDMENGQQIYFEALVDDLD